jgi:hypothetical protein
MASKPVPEAAMTMEGTVRVPEHVHARVFDGDLVILDLANGEYFSLDPVGARMWEGVSAGQSPEAIAKRIAQEYDVTVNRALEDLRTLVDQLSSRGLLILDDASKA